MMEGQFRPNSDMHLSTQKSEAPLRLYVGVVYLAIGIVLFLLNQLNF